MVVCTFKKTEEYNDGQEVHEYKCVLDKEETAMRRMNQSNIWGIDEKRLAIFNCKGCPFESMYISPVADIEETLALMTCDKKPCDNPKNLPIDLFNHYHTWSQPCNLIVLKDECIVEGEDMYHVVCLNCHDRGCKKARLTFTIDKEITNEEETKYAVNR